MGQKQSTASRSAWRTFFVALLGFYVIASTFPGLTFLWDSTDVSYGPRGPLGFETDYDGVIKAITPDSPGARAGIQPGDRVDLARTSFQSRPFIAASLARVAAGKHVAVWIIHNGGERLVNLVTPYKDNPPLTKLNLLMRTIAATVFVVVGGLLVILRPSIMTWGFYFYCLGFSPGIAFLSFSRFPSATAHAINILSGDLLTAAGSVGILVFALHFLCDDPAPWRRRLDRSVPYLLVAFIFLVSYPDVANLIIGVPAEMVQRIMLALQGVVFGLSIFATVQTYLHGKPEDRPRMQWVVIGLILGTSTTYLGSVVLFSSALPFNPPRWIELTLLSLNVILPLTVAYAVIRHRVFEVSFVVSRALIYAILTSTVLLMFGFIDWFLGRELEAVRLARFVEIAVAIGISFWLNSLEKRVENVVESVFFRQRQAAMRRLKHSAEAVHNASELSTIFDFLTVEPTEALSLSSAAVFLRGDAGWFARVAAVGWPETTMSRIMHDDPLALNLESDFEPLRVADIGWHPSGLPAGPAAPILAVPTIARRDLTGILLYGPHTNGADIDPDEVDAIFHLAKAAQATYDHVRMVELSDEVDKLKAQLAGRTADATRASAG
jgi:hypothetical protein